MSLPVCPKCRSGYVEPNPCDTGNNRCHKCGHVGPVASFHEPKPTKVIYFNARKVEPEPQRIVRARMYWLDN